MSRQFHGPDVMQVHDTTLRDGTQSEGIALSCDDRIQIVRPLDQPGVTCIAGGWHGGNGACADCSQVEAATAAVPMEAS